MQSADQGQKKKITDKVPLMEHGKQIFFEARLEIVEQVHYVYSEVQPDEVIVRWWVFVVFFLRRPPKGN